MTQKLTGVKRAMTMCGCVLGIAAAGVLVSGCTTANERHSYISTARTAVAVTLVNTATGEKVWSCDVPSGQRLDIRFAQTGKRAEEAGKDEMSWTLSGQGVQAAGRRSTIMVPPPSQRRFDMTQEEIPDGKK